MIFLTVGTQFSFERLVRRVDEIVGGGGFNEEIFAQIGPGTYRPRNFKFAEYIDKAQFDKLFNKAKGIVGHAGMGTIIAALQLGKPLLVMPRLAKYGEVVNDHQLAIAGKFQKHGYLLAAFDESQLGDKLRELSSFVPRTTQSDIGAITAAIKKIIGQVESSAG